MTGSRPLKLVGGLTLGVEVDEVTVGLVERDSDGQVARAFMVTPREARRLAWALLEAASAAEEQ